MNKKRDLGQVFTPLVIVNKILDDTGFIDSNVSIVDSNVIETSVGEGIFLQEVVRRVIDAGRKVSLPDSEIAHRLSENIVGIDIDPDVIEKCISHLNNVLVEKDFQYSVEWNIFAGNALSYEPGKKFDYIVGNPPYIRVHHMSQEIRQSVKNFESSTGITDLYVVFFELGIRWLSNEGKLGYITPNSWLKNVSQKKFRRFLINNNLISRISDYGAYTVFNDADAYTAITILDKTKQGNDFVYQKMKDNDTIDYSVSISSDELVDYQGNALIFSRNGFLKNQDGVKLKDIAVIQNGVQFSRDKIFINPDCEIETEFLKPVIKISRYKGQYDGRKVIFPYKKSAINKTLFDDSIVSKTIPVQEEELNDYPHLKEYLLSRKDELEDRSIDKKALWFHYGRSQGIQNMLNDKLVLSNMFSPGINALKAYIVDSDTIVYKGLFITEKPNSKYSLQDIKVIIESSGFLDYMKAVAHDKSGGYKELSAKMVNDFVIPDDLLK